MLFPLEELIKYEGNMYELTCAATRRANQLSLLHDAEMEDFDDKPVSLAERQIFSREVEFRLDDGSGSGLSLPLA